MKIARQMGTPLMPWQELVAMVGLEMTDDGTPAYRQIWVSVPRQNGKTTLVLVWVLDRALYWGPRQLMVYSAQSGQDARKKMLEDYVPALEASPFWPLIGENRVRKAAGDVGIGFKNQSRIDVISNSASAGHGRTLDLGVIDEAFDDMDDRREQAIAPAQITRRNAQIFGCSTMGTDESVYLNRKVDIGRAATLEADATVAYFEWSSPVDVDIADPAVWADCNPAFGYTITEPVMRSEFESMQEGEFRRAHLNQRTQSEERVIPAAVWEKIVVEAGGPTSRVTLGVDVNPERSSGTIVAADAHSVQVLEHQRGMGWVVPAAAQLARKWGAAGVALDPSGPAGAFQEQLSREGVRVVPVAGRDLSKACAAFYDSVADQTIQVSRNAALDAAVGAAMKRTSGDAWTWSRQSVTDISPLVCATVALWAARQHPDPVSQVF